MGPVMMLCIALAAIVSGDGSSDPDAFIEYKIENLDGNTLPNTGSGSATYDLDLTSAIQNNYASIDGQCSNELCFADISDSAASCIPVPLDIGTSSIPNLSFEVYLKQRSYHAHLAWIMSQDDGAFDRSIIMEDTRFGGNEDRLSLGVGGTYTSNINSLTLNKYIHLVAIWRGGAGGSASIYLDGNLEQTTSIQSNSVSSINYFCLNTNPKHNSHGWDGCMNQVRVFKSALSESQVEALYAEAKDRENCDPCIGVTCDPGFVCDSSDGGACSRDCTTFHIDGFLLECSDEWDNAGKAMTTEATTRKSEDTRLEGLITDEAATRLEKDNNLENAINTEATTRAQQDDALQTSINAEKTAREQAINGEQAARAAAIASEESARGAAITAEATARGGSDNTLQGNIDSEETARKAACDALQTLIDNAQSDIDDLTDRLDGFKEPKNPKAQNIGINVDHNLNDVNGKKFWWSNMEIVIVILLVMNLSMMIYVHCISKRGKHKYRKIRYNESDVDSEANLKC